MNTALKPSEYTTLPLELWTVTDLTDALTVEVAAALLNTTKRTIYTTRSTNIIAVDRAVVLIDAVRKDEANCRQRLVVRRNAQYTRAEKTY